MGTESINNQAPQQEASSRPELSEMERENQMVFAVREKVKEIIQSMLENKDELSVMSQKFLSCMTSGNTEEAVNLARSMAMQAELADDLKKMTHYYTASDQLPLDSEYNRALVDTRIITTIPTTESINELLDRYTVIQDNPTNNPYLRKLVELKETVSPFWEAYEQASKN